MNRSAIKRTIGKLHCVSLRFAGTSIVCSKNYKLKIFYVTLVDWICEHPISTNSNTALENKICGIQACL